MRLGLIYTIITPENKLLLSAAQARGVELERISDDSILMDVHRTGDAASFDAVLQRSSSYSRSLYISQYFEEAGTRVVNSYATQRLFGDKASTSFALARAKIRTPRTIVACSPESARAAARELGFPLVIKPPMGSWARMVQRINDNDSLDAAIECREEMGNVWQKIYYLQEFVKKPGRDIRVFVVGNEAICAIYRNSTEKSGWITNTGRGGTASNCPLTPEICELAIAASSKLAGEGIYGVDMMEGPEGLMVHEVNHTTEFRNSIAPTGTDIPGKMIDFLIQHAKR
jgi:[lysine-biosynthesis-protein LysW]--L-2-aminoadipate ligase